MRWIILVCLLTVTSPAYAQKASWYDSKSVCKEGTCCDVECPTASGIDINGLEARDEDFCAASKQFKMGSKLKITNRANGKWVICTVRDRGGFGKYGRHADLGRKSFAKIADPRLGVIDVDITVVG